MSTKTLRKRIALVAVSALGAGLLSVVAVPSANAASTATINSIAASTGLLANGTANATTTKTATLLSTGTLAVDFGSGNTGYAVITSGSAYVSSAGTTAIAGVDGTVDADQLGGIGRFVLIKPTGAIGSTFVVETFDDASDLTMGNKVTVTIAGSSVAGTVVPANSYVNWTADNTASTVEDASKAATTTGNLLYIYVQLRDAYKADITSTSGALIATASAGAKVKIGNGAIATGGNAATAVSTESPAALYIAVSEATAGAGWNGTVTVTYNGVTIATKTGKISGKITKLAVSAVKIGSNANSGAANAASLEYQASDAAGNNIVLPFADVVYSSSTNPAMVSAAAGSVVNTTSLAGNATFTCANSSSLYGKADIVLQTTLSDGTVVKSNAVTVQCGGNALVYRASWDKAIYAQGDIATLTIAFADSKGSVANSYGTVSGSPADQAITANQMERVTAHGASATPDGNGQIKYTFTVGTSTGVVAGKYNAVVSLPTLNANTYAANQSAAYEISGSGAVSNADVLKAIVSLIASINKQIAALQKALLKR
jgi:hypothetical protein